jgi:nicotinamide-nucleotide amidase|tara:strand:- start:488 stop:976 length:489 start_codon:yes stop_codon:yes gene_type:complete
MYSNDLELLVENLGAQCLLNSYHLVIAESCTGGMICSAITQISGSSQWFTQGFITYSDQSKIDLLGVSEGSLKSYGAVSQQVANEMACGALRRSQGSLSLSITGIAGPSGGTKTKPVGTVFFSVCNKKGMLFEHEAHFEGTRKEIREKGLLFALNSLLKLTL